MRQAARQGVTRRTARRRRAGALALPAAGCGIRLEDDAPRVPLVPARTPVPAEAELVALTRDTAGARRAGGDGARRPRSRPRDDPPSPAHGAAHDLAAPSRCRPPLPRRHARTSREHRVTPHRRRRRRPTSPSPTAIRARALADGRGRARRRPPPSSPGSRPTCSPPSRPCTPSGMPRRSCSPAARPRCRSTRWRGQRSRPWRHRRRRRSTCSRWSRARSTGGPARPRRCHPADALRRLRADQVAGGSRAGGHHRPPAALRGRRQHGCRPAGPRGAPTLRAGYGEHLGPIAASESGAGLAAADPVAGHGGGAGAPLGRRARARSPGSR